MVNGDLWYSSFREGFTQGENQGAVSNPGLADTFPPDEFEIIGQHLINVTGGGGKLRSVHIVIARELPDVPAQVTGVAAVTGGGTGEVDITWSIPSDGGSPITDYLIEFSLDGIGIFSIFVDGVSNVASVTVDGLSIGTTYDFKISAINAKGTGPASVIATATSSG